MNEYAKQVAAEMQKPVWNATVEVSITASDQAEANRKVSELRAVLMKAPYVIETTLVYSPIPESGEEPKGTEEEANSGE